MIKLVIAALLGLVTAEQLFDLNEGLSLSEKDMKKKDGRRRSVAGELIKWGEDAGDALEDAADEVEDAADDIGDAAEDVLDDAGDALEDAADELEDVADDAADGLEDAAEEIGREAEKMGRHIEHDINDLGRDIERLGRDIEHELDDVADAADNLGRHCPYVGFIYPFDYKKYSGQWLLFRQTYNNPFFHNTQTGKCNFHTAEIDQPKGKYWTRADWSFYTDRVNYKFVEPEANLNWQENRMYYRQYKMDYQESRKEPNEYVTSQFKLQSWSDMQYNVLDTDYENYSVVYSCTKKPYDQEKESLFIYTRKPVDTSNGYEAYNTLMTKIRRGLEKKELNMSQKQLDQLFQNLGPIQKFPNTEEENCHFEKPI